ncbi:ribonuclease Z [Paenibacillus thermoaerophilus]|uniref:Ribonuclease Z n=1 Tax=Paenibacillus thermoaerophilus TaxID=1215385 RepID=A0ABW2V3S3_9BACL|nr:ribonuclease Z [Paenibacillus thermoaerophilus]TMV17130.1 ribonuclease Z [Paenibacillus thermoaerophilus]
MDLLFLGTGAGMPSRERNVSAIALRLHEERSSFWLFDCGEGTQHQVLRSPLRLSKLEYIFITHLHGDHLYGLPGLLSSRSNQGGETPVTIFGPKGLKDYLKISLEVSETYLRYDWKVVELGETGGTVIDDGQFEVTAKPLDHRIACFGYRVHEYDRPGTLLIDKLKAAGVPPGPVYGRLKAGETVTLEDGRTLNGAEFVGPPEKGRVVAILGDTRPCPEAVELASGADVLVHEATFDAELAELAKQFHHSTSRQAAEIARKAGAKQLVLTHISSRYQESGAEVLLEQARELLPGTTVAEDGAVVPVRRRP